MEYVGWDANVIHGSIHTESYNHSIGTQKTATTTVSTAESEFHVYALEWSKTKIQVFVDDKAYFTFYNDGKNDKNTWPFNAPFYLKLNLAVGGRKVLTIRFSHWNTTSITSGFIRNSKKLVR